jgi:hypothetical protein
MLVSKHQLRGRWTTTGRMALFIGLVRIVCGLEERFRRCDDWKPRTKLLLIAFPLLESTSGLSSWPRRAQPIYASPCARCRPLATVRVSPIGQKSAELGQEH